MYLRWKGLEKAGKGDLYVRSGPGTVRLGGSDIEQYVATPIRFPMSGGPQAAGLPPSTYCHTSRTTGISLPR